MPSKFPWYLSLVLIGSLSGCATIVNDAVQPVKIETQTQDGKFITGADCTMTNDYGSVVVKSGSTAQIRRSSNDLDIHCQYAGHPDAKGRAISRVNAGLFGNIIFGGGVGAIIDHGKGTAYTYPTWMQLVFGKTLVFDRNAEKEGTPTPGVEPTQAAGGK